MSGKLLRLRNSQAWCQQNQWSRADPSRSHRAREIDPDATIQVERVRNTEGGHRDKWRRP